MATAFVVGLDCPAYDGGFVPKVIALTFAAAERAAEVVYYEDHPQRERRPMVADEANLADERRWYVRRTVDRDTSDSIDVMIQELPVMP